MKRTILILACLLILMSFLFINTYAEEGLYLTTIAEESKTGYIPPIMDTRGIIKSHSQDYFYDHSIEAHPVSVDEASYIIYDISEYSYNHFTAYLGKNAILEAGSHVVFVLWADEEIIYESPPVTIGDEPLACVVAIPQGTKKLTLEVNAGSDGLDYDTATWGSPMLTNLSVTEIKESRSVSKNKYKLGEDFNPSGGIYVLVYSNGMEFSDHLKEDMVSGFDSTKEGTQTLTASYEDVSYTFDVTVEKEEEKAQETPAPTEKAKEEEKTIKKTNLPLIIGGIVGVVVLAGLVVIIVIKRKK